MLLSQFGKVSPVSGTNRMEPHAVQSNNTVSDIPKEIIENAPNTESTVADERKNDKELSSSTDEMRSKSVSDINEEVSSEILSISLARAQVGCLKKKLLVLDINGLLVDLVFPVPTDCKADTVIARVACEQRLCYSTFLMNHPYFANWVVSHFSVQETLLS